MLPIVVVDGIKCVAYNGKFVRIGSSKHQKILADLQKKALANAEKFSDVHSSIRQSKPESNPAQLKISLAHQAVFG